jgi:hypothetical protein
MVARIHHVAEIQDEALLEKCPGWGLFHFNVLSDFRKLQLSKPAGPEGASPRHRSSRKVARRAISCPASKRIVRAAGQPQFTPLPQCRAPGVTIYRHRFGNRRDGP